MKEPTPFLSRWSRLKRQTNSERRTPARERAAENLGEVESAAPDAGSVDCTDLPSLDAITRETDISVFLRSQVPAEMTRAALRRAWASDPAIRDFIGIAENQWDFNDPNAMPGFGALRATDTVAAFLAQAVGRGVAGERPEEAPPTLGTGMEKAPLPATQPDPKPDTDPLDQARAREYALLATLLARAPGAALIRQLASIKGDESQLGQAHAALAQGADETSASDVGRAYFELFAGLGRGQLLPYASYYLTGSLYGRPLARVRESFERLQIEPCDPGEPEDHIAVLFETMAGLVGGDIAASPRADREFFQAHLAPWARRFCLDLEHAETAGFYRCVGSLARTFMEIEAEAYSLSV